MRRFRLRHDLLLRTAALFFFGIALSGCGPGAAWALALAAMLGLGSLALSGCSESHTLRSDAEVPAPDAGPGSWERCCDDGRVSTCFCPAMTACNYGMGLVVCDDGSCGYGFPGSGFSCGDVDAGPPPVDAGGDWEPCCEDGVITTCFCPAGVECNYGWYTTCPDGSCTLGGGGSCAADAGVAPDAGPPGTWDACCVDGRVDVCFCPAGAICNYGWYEDCGEGTCAWPGEGCPG